MPDNAYEMMTAPSKQITSAVSNTIGQLANAYTGYQAQQAGLAASQQGAAAQYSGLESLSQATGVPMNAELANQYANIGGMSPQQQAVFQNSLGQEAQRMQMLYGINQAQARAAQAQGQMQQGLSNQDVLTRGLNAPFSSGGSSNAGGGAATNMSGSYMPYGSGGMDMNNPLFRY